MLNWFWTLGERLFMVISPVIVSAPIDKKDYSKKPVMPVKFFEFSGV
jgi:hypothetical protein